MGLDVLVYINLKKSDSINAIDGEGNIRDGYIHIWTPEDFISRIEGLAAGKYYEAVEKWWFNAGSYTSYNEWRNELAKLAGYESDEYVWNNIKKGDFFEIINFPDCEGIIGTVVSTKLYKDFIKFENKAKAKGEEFYEMYQHFMNAFGEASNGNGCVSFH